MSEWIPRWSGSIERVVATGLLVGAPACITGHADCVDRLDVCDIALESCQQHVYVQTACAREFEGREAPFVREITRDEFEELLRGDDDPTAEEERADAQMAAALRMVSLLDPTATSSEDAAIAAYASNVLAFYSRDDRSITIIETNLSDDDEETAVFVLSHEFVHAQQDIDVGLQDFFDEFSTSADSDTATRSVSEGEAMVFSNLTMARMPGARIERDGFEAYFADQKAELRDAAADPALADYTTLRTSFPYPFGGDFVMRTWYDGGRDGVLALYDDPPRSTAEVMRSLGDESGEVDIDIPSSTLGTLPDGWSTISDETFGGWIVFAVARRHALNESDADAIAKDWRGDRWIVVGGPTEAEFAFGWTVRFGSSAGAQSFERIGEQMPPEGVWSVTREGEDVTIVGAADETSLSTWQDAFQASVEPAPSFRSAPRGAERRWDVQWTNR